MSKTGRKIDRCVLRRQEKAPHLVLFSLRDQSYVALRDRPVEICVHVRHSTKLDAHESTEASACDCFVFFVHGRACVRTASHRQLRGVAMSVRAGQSETTLRLSDVVEGRCAGLCNWCWIVPWKKQAVRFRRRVEISSLGQSRRSVYSAIVPFVPRKNLAACFRRRVEIS
ncbi:unnamed protein product [Ixodes pacificus]